MLERIVVITPNKKLVDEDCEFLTVLGDEGQVGILPNHIPLIMKISNGYIKIVNGDSEKFVVITGGVLDNNKNVIIIVAQEGAIGSSLEEATNVLNKIRAERLKMNKEKLVDFAEAELELAKAIKEANSIKI